MEDLIFRIQPYDLLAVETINFWIDRATQMGVSPEKIEKADAHLRAVIEYQSKNPDKVKLPD